MAEQEVDGPTRYRLRQFEASRAAHLFDLKLQETVRMSAHENLVGVKWFGPEVPLGPGRGGTWESNPSNPLEVDAW